MTNSPAFDLLMWARGPGFDYALIIFIAGILLRVLEFLLLGRKKDLSKAKGKPVSQGLITILKRSLPHKEVVRTAPLEYISAYVIGYTFHIGFFVVLLFFAPHIKLFEDAFGISWAALPTTIIEAVTAITIVAMVAMLLTRLGNSVRRYLSTFEDYLVWLLCLLPLVTGYIAVNKLFGDYQMMLALHILSVEALMVAFPFTKLMHAVTVFMSRYYNGAIQGRKGAES